MMSTNKSMKNVKLKNRALSFHDIWIKYKAITKNLAFSVALDLYPITPTEVKVLKEILKVVEPFYQFPNEKQLYDIIIPRLYDQVKQKVLLAIKYDFIGGAKKIALSIDGWTGRSITDHMSVTVHYWSLDYEPRHFLLQLECLPRAWNTAQDLYHLIENVLLKFGLKDEKSHVHIVTGNGQNIVEAISMNDKWFRIPCLARLLQMTIDDVLKTCFSNFDSLIARCEFVVSSLWSRTGKSAATSKRSSSILHDLVPSWNSIFEMLDSLLKLRSTLGVFLEVAPSLAEQLTEADWVTISRYVNTFSLIKQASELLSNEASAYPSLSLYLPTIRAILEVMESMKLDEQLAGHLIRSICTRFDHINTNESMIVAMVLDPRFKTRLLSDDEKFTVHDIVKNKMTRMLSAYDKRVASNDKIIKINRDSSLDAYFTRISEKANYFDDDYIEKICEAELSYYLCEYVVPMDTRVHAWWGKNAFRFPKLCELAKSYLIIPAVQVSVERAFLNKRGFITDRRAELLADHVNVLDLMRISFLNHNLCQFEADNNL